MPPETDRTRDVGGDDAGDDGAAILERGDLTVLGRIRVASNATFLCEAALDGRTRHCVYKPVAGERPLWDFPDGTLAGRERASYLVARALDWNVVPHTIIRDGPAGAGMVQLWVDEPEGADLVDLCRPDRVPTGFLPVLQAYDYAGNEVTLIHADDARLRQLAVFDVLVNNADRKGGHILRGGDGALYGVDHGLCLHTEDKLRTVLWGWAGKPIDDDTLASIAALHADLDDGLADRLDDHITAREVAALRARAAGLLDNPVLPGPDRHRPIPWPAF